MEEERRKLTRETGEGCHPVAGWSTAIPVVTWSRSQGALVKLLRYGWGTPLELYLAQVRLAARYSRWGDEEAAIHLALALDGPAAQVLLDLPPVDRGSFEGLTTTLKRRFGQRQSVYESREHLANFYRRERERLGALAADVRLLTQRGYPRFSPDDQEDLVLYAFLRALSPERLQQYVRLAARKAT